MCDHVLSWWFFYAIRYKTFCLLPFLPPFSTIALKVIANSTEKVKDIKGIQVGKKGINLSSHINDINIYGEGPKEPTTRTPATE